MSLFLGGAGYGIENKSSAVQEKIICEPGALTLTVKI